MRYLIKRGLSLILAFILGSNILCANIYAENVYTAKSVLDDEETVVLSAEEDSDMEEPIPDIIPDGIKIISPAMMSTASQAISLSDAKKYVNKIESGEVKNNLLKLFEEFPPNKDGSTKIYNKTTGTYWTNKINGKITSGSKCGGAWQCFGFALYCYAYMFHCLGTNNNTSDSNMLLGNVSTVSYKTFNNAGVKPGAHIRCVSSGNHGHSMILLYYDADCIVVYHANGDGNGTVYAGKYTWAQFNSSQLSGHSPVRHIYYVAMPKKYPAKPDKPEITKWTAEGMDSVTIKWGKVSGATSYTIERRKKIPNTTEARKTIKTGVTGTSFTDTGLETGSIYYYNVSAVNSAGSNRSASCRVWTRSKKPSVSALSPTSVKISWDPVQFAKNYRIDRRIAVEGTEYETIKTGITTTEYTDNTVSPNTPYYYRIYPVAAEDDWTITVRSETSSKVTTPLPKHAIDLNSILDGTELWNLGECGTVDIYINGNLDADDVTDYWKEWPEGTKYEIRDIKTKDGYYFKGTNSGSTFGTVGTGNVDLRLVYAIVGKEMTSGYDRRLPDGDYRIVSAANPSYYLDIPGTDVPAANGSNVQLYGPNNGNLNPSDVWTIAYSDGFYSIRQKGSDASLDVTGGSADIRANVQVWQKNNNSSQKWAINYFDGGKGYRIQSKCSGMSLDIYGGDIAAGANVVQFTQNSSDAQRWLFIPYEPPKTVEDGRYILVSGIDTHIELDVPGNTGDVSEGTNVQIWNDQCPSQFNSFDVKYVGNGYYNLVHAASGKCLEVNGANTDNYANIQISASNGANNQKWCIIPQNGGYMLVNRNSGLTMDVQDAKTADGTNVRQHYYNGAKAQTWIFKKAEYKVTYDANGGTGAPAAQTKYYANALTLAAGKPTAANKNFKGWATSKTATAAEYQPGGSYAEDKDLTLYAVWEDTVVKPQITKHPTAVTAEAGTTARYSVTATGTGLTYQWQFKEVGSNTWNKCGLTGSKTANLQVPVTSGRNGYSYRCVVTDSYGNVVNSNGALLTVKEDFAITKHPQDASAAVGKTVQFSVTATGTGLTYQWQYQEAGSTTWNKCGLSGADTNTVSVPVTAARNGYSYHCIVKNASGQSKTSNAAKLTIPAVEDKLSITKHPVSRSSTVGKTVTFSVTATGKGLTYQWQYRPAGSSIWSKCGLEGAKTDTVTVPVTNGRNGTSYRCAVTDSKGTILYSNAATLILQEDLKITRQPASVTASTGSTVYFSVEATGVGLMYQWQYQESGKSAWNKCGLAGAKTATVTVTATPGRDGYGYRCVVTDSEGNTKESDKAILTVSTSNSAKSSLLPDPIRNILDTIGDLMGGDEKEQTEEPKDPENAGENNEGEKEETDNADQSGTDAPADAAEDKNTEDNTDNAESSDKQGLTESDSMNENGKEPISDSESDKDAVQNTDNADIDVSPEGVEVDNADDKLNDSEDEMPESVEETDSQDAQDIQVIQDNSDAVLTEPEDGDFIEVVETEEIETEDVETEDVDFIDSDEEYEDAVENEEVIETDPEYDPDENMNENVEEEYVDESIEEDMELPVESGEAIILYDDISQFSDETQLPFTSVRVGETLQIGFGTEDDWLTYQWEFRPLIEDVVEAEWEALNMDTVSDQIVVIDGSSLSVLTFEAITPGTSFQLRCSAQDAYGNVITSVEVPIVVEE